MTSTWPGAPLDIATPAFLTRLQSGECDAYEELAGDYGPALYSTALRITGSPSDAEDALQETFLSAYQHMDTFQERSSLKTWLTRICINAALTRLRRNGRHKAESLDDPIGEEGLPRPIPDPREDPEQELRGRELRRLLEHYLARLSPALREVFVLRDIEELSGEETAQMLGITVNAVKTRLSRARTALRQLLTPHLLASRALRQTQIKRRKPIGAKLFGAQPKLGRFRVPALA